MIYTYSFLFGLLFAGGMFFGPVPWGGFLWGGGLILSILEYFPFFRTQFYGQGLFIILFVYPILLSLAWFFILLSFKNKLRLSTQKFKWSFIAGLFGILIPTAVVYYGFTHITIGKSWI